MECIFAYSQGMSVGMSCNFIYEEGIGLIWPLDEITVQEIVDNVSPSPIQPTTFVMGVTDVSYYVYPLNKDMI